MKKISIRDIITPFDMLLFSDWVFRAADVNCFVDSDLIFNYKRAIMLCADDDEGPVCYLPVQSVLMLRDPKQIEGCEARAIENEQREVYCLTDNPLAVPLDWEELVNFRILKRDNTTTVTVKPDSVLMLESLAPMPGLSPRKEALALIRFGDAVDSIASQTGHAASYFICRDDRVADICIRHRYTEMLNLKLFRKKIELGAQSAKKGETANEVSRCAAQQS